MKCDPNGSFEKKPGTQTAKTRAIGVEERNCQAGTKGTNPETGHAICILIGTPSQVNITILAEDGECPLIYPCGNV